MTICLNKAWCPKCQIYFGISNDEKEVVKCPMCNFSRTDDFIQIDPNTFYCKVCKMRFGLPAGEVVKCRQCGNGEKK